MIEQKNINEFDPSDLIDNEESVINIDTECIDIDSLKEAEGLISNLQDIYADQEFMKDNPKFVVRLKAEIEDLRILLKVRKSDEVVHDILLGAIGKNSNNASLYRSLKDIQTTILSTTSEISSKIKDINAMLKNIQLELPFKENVDENQMKDEEFISTYRGSKDFIKAMKLEMEEKKEPL